MKRILVAIDGSDASLKSLALAAQIARGLQAQVTLAYVCPPVLLPAQHYGAVVAEIEKDHRRYAEELFQRALKQVQAAGVAAETLVLKGESAAEALADAAEAQDVELVAIGSRGRGAVARMLLGSVADRLVHICKKPVLVVH